MSPFDLDASIERAKRRLGHPGPGRTGRARGRVRSDAGSSRLDPRVVACVHEALSGQDRPAMSRMMRDLVALCREAGLAPPSRATVYKLMGSAPCATRRMGDLPQAVQSALYNLGPDSEVPEHQIAFYCFNYGDARAMSFASGLGWLAIYQALRLPGYRPGSRGIIEAVATTRGIVDGRA